MRLTKILHVLVKCKVHSYSLLRLARASACSISLVDDYAISCSGSDEGRAIRELSPPAIEVESKVRKTISEGAKKERNMAGKPGKLKSLSKSHESLTERHVGRRWWSHGGECCCSEISHFFHFNYKH